MCSYTNVVLTVWYSAGKREINMLQIECIWIFVSEKWLWSNAFHSCNALHKCISYTRNIIGEWVHAQIGPTVYSYIVSTICAAYHTYGEADCGSNSFAPISFFADHPSASIPFRGIAACPLGALDESIVRIPNPGTLQKLTGCQIAAITITRDKGFHAQPRGRFLRPPI